MTVDANTTSVRIPSGLYQVVRRFAHATHRSVDDVLQSSLMQWLPPLEDVPESEAAELAGLSMLDDGALWRVAREQLSQAEQEESYCLLDGQAEGNLSQDEALRLQSLLDQYNHATVRKAHAYLLLARRGYRVPGDERA